MSKPSYKELEALLKELERAEAERKRVEAALKESEERLRSLKDNIQVGIYRSTPGPTGKYIEVNPAICKIFGFDTREEFLKIRPADIYFHPEERAKFSEKVLKYGVVKNEELKLKRNDGTPIICSTSVQAVKDRQGNIVYFDGIVEDITERKQAEEERAAEIRFLETMEQIDGIIIKAADLQQMMSDVLDIVISAFQCDRAWLLYPCDPEPPNFKVLMECTRPEYPGLLAIGKGKEIPNTPDTAEIFKMVLESAEGPICSDPKSHGPIPDAAKQRFTKSQIIMGIYPKVGKPWLFGLHQCSYARIWSDEEQFLFYEIGHRITDSLSSLLFLRNLQESEERFRELFDSISSGVAVYEAVADGQDFIFKDFNKAGEGIDKVKKKSLIGKRVTKAFPGIKEFGLLDVLKRVWLTGKPEHHPTSFYKDKRIRGWRENYVYKLSTGEVVAVYDDVTYSKKAEEETRILQEQLFQAQKMESIGRLAGGIAHDFNNILTGMMGFAELLKMKYEDLSTKEGKAAEVILNGVERASTLTRQLLGFARGGKYEPKPRDLNEVVKDAIKMSEKIFEKNILVRLEFAEKLAAIEADKNQLDQMLTNLIINAKDAMPNGGELTFSTENIHLDEKSAKNLPGLKPGNFVTLCITDTGIGMTPQVKDHIFEPFFTTKGDGEGTGLGLATVYSIIKNHNGHIDVASSPGKGTSFTVYFPASAKEIKKEEKKDEPIRGEETILVVDDEEGVRDSASTALKNLGYKVLTACDGIEALKIYKENKGKVDLVLLDMVMPNMAGRETFLELKKVDPQVKVLLFSGYSQNGKATEVLNKGALGFIQKPYKLRELAEIISESCQK